MKNFHKHLNRKSVLLILLLFTPLFVLGQEFVVSGNLKSDKGEPLYFATVHQKDGNRYVYSNEKGDFQITLPKGRVTLLFSSIGFAQQEFVFELNQDIKGLEIELKEQSLSLDEVTIVAKSVENKSGTSVYEIGEQAIKQVQAMNLGDVLTLLPGKKIVPSNLNNALQPNLRNAVTSNVNNFGTAVIMDGVQISNDGNMQAFNPASSLSGGKGVVAQSIDLRSITTSGIEKVEVITGVASPKYGDITSGSIIVTNKVGKSPLYASVNLTPTSYQFSVNKGIQLKDKWGFLNSDISYTHSYASPIVDKEFFVNINAAFRWKAEISRALEWTNTTSFQFSTSNNGRKDDPDESFINISRVSNQKYSLAISGTLKFLGSTSYSFHGSVDDQYSYQKYRDNDGPFPLVSGLTAGTYFTSYSPLSYELETEIKGFPINFGGRVESDQNINSGNYRFTFNTGMQYSYVKNLGKGRTMLGSVVGNYGANSSRNAKFHEIPASQTVSGYHETNIRRITDQSRHELRLGARYDYMNMRYHLLSPRLSYSVIFLKALKLRGSWGIAYKAPAMIQLYPTPIYIDYRNFDHYANNPAERLAIVTTEIIEPTNDHLTPNKGDTKEFGIDWEGDKWQVRSTFFHKELRRGITYAKDLMIFEKQDYRIIDRPEGKMPIVEPIEGDITLIPREVGTLQNKYSSTTDGFELSLSPPRIESSKTEIDFKFSYLKTSEKNEGHKLAINQYSVDGADVRFGAYEHPTSYTYLSSGNLTIIQHIPALRLIFNMVVELNFISYTDRTEGSLYPYAYYSRDGVMHDIPLADRQNPEYANLKLPDHTYTTILKPPFYTNYHLQVRKETRDGHSFSFFANNVWWYNPVYYREGAPRELNSRIAFGFGLSFKLK